MLSLAAAATALLVPSLDPTSHSRLMTRRGVLAACGLATTATPKQASAKSDFKWGPLAQMTEAQMDALDEASREPSAGVLLPSGVRVIDMVVGDGPEPATGKRVYCHYKVWAGGFRAGKVADWSFYDDRPYDWVLGQPTERLPTGVDEGVRGMREGGWRRMVVPAAYGDTGLKKVNIGVGKKRYTGLKAPFVIAPGEAAYFDLIMLDGGSGRCEAMLRPPGLSEAETAKLKSMTCSSRNEIF